MDFIKEKFYNLAITNKETCSHFIDYEIYDALPENLKDKYVNQFPTAQLGFTPIENEWKGFVRCRANENDPPHINVCDCTDKYSKTLKMFEQFIRDPIGFERKTD